MKWLINQFLKRSFHLISPDDILRFDGKTFWLGKTQLSEPTSRGLLAEAQVFGTSDLWGHLKTQVRAEAGKQLFEKAVTPDQVWFAKGIYYAVQLLDDKIKNLNKIS